MPSRWTRILLSMVGMFILLTHDVLLRERSPPEMPQYVRIPVLAGNRRRTHTKRCRRRCRPQVFRMAIIMPGMRDIMSRDHPVKLGLLRRPQQAPGVVLCEASLICTRRQPRTVIGLCRAIPCFPQFLLYLRIHMLRLSIHASSRVVTPLEVSPARTIGSRSITRTTRSRLPSVMLDKSLWPHL